MLIKFNIDAACIWVWMIEMLPIQYYQCFRGFFIYCNFAFDRSSQPVPIKASNVRDFAAKVCELILQFSCILLKLSSGAHFIDVLFRGVVSKKRMVGGWGLKVTGLQHSL